MENKTAPINNSEIKHIIVLMLENRSFDHMLGYLDYFPNEKNQTKKKKNSSVFEGLWGKGGDQIRKKYNSIKSADYEIMPGPGHSFENIQKQISNSGKYLNPDQFVKAYEKEIKNIYKNKKLDKWVDSINVLRSFGKPSKNKASNANHVNVLHTLAKEFALCDHWFSSLPGETWPNRNFALAATSDGEVDINASARLKKRKITLNNNKTINLPRLFQNQTIFEQLSEDNLDWGIYYDGFPPQSLVFTNLWYSQKQNISRFRGVSHLYKAIKEDKLPHYSWVEPDQVGLISSSQHPWFGDELGFKSGEHLIWKIYDSLKNSPKVFQKTLLLITYDEHGGFYDHVKPPSDPSYSVKEKYLDPNNSNNVKFNFNQLGIRVPAIVVSPWINERVVCHDIFDHSSIPATIRSVFHLKSQHLSEREKGANTFDIIIGKDSTLPIKEGNKDLKKKRKLPRQGKDLPDIKEPKLAFAKNANKRREKYSDPYADSLKKLIKVFPEMLIANLLTAPTTLEIEQKDMLVIAEGLDGWRNEVNIKIQQYVVTQSRNEIINLIDSSEEFLTLRADIVNIPLKIYMENNKFQERFRSIFYETGKEGLEIDPAFLIKPSTLIEQDNYEVKVGDVFNLPGISILTSLVRDEVIRAHRDAVSENLNGTDFVLMSDEEFIQLGSKMNESFSTKFQKRELQNLFLREYDFSTIRIANEKLIIGIGSIKVSSFFEGLGKIIENIKRKAENKLDPVTAWLEYNLKKLSDKKYICMRTENDVSIMYPNRSQIKSHIYQLFASKKGESCLWFADHENRWLTFYGDGSWNFLDVVERNPKYLYKESQELPNMRKSSHQSKKSGKIKFTKQSSDHYGFRLMTSQAMEIYKNKLNQK